MPPFSSEAKTPRSISLWMISEVEQAFPGSDEGSDRVRKACKDLKDWVEREWTQEREKELIAREKVRWDSVKADAISIQGQAKWDEMEGMTADMRSRLKTSFEVFEKEFFQFEKESEEWKALTKRLRDAAASGASKQNVVQATEEAKSKTTTFLKKDSGILADMISGEITLSSLAEKAGLEAAKHIGVTTQEKDQDKIAALGALVRFKKSGVKPTSPAALLVKVSDAVPICLSESKKLEEAVCRKPGAKSYITWSVSKMSEVLSEDRIKAVLDSLDKMEVSGGRDTMAKLGRAIHERDVAEVERIVKSMAIATVIKLLPQLDLPPIEGVRDGVHYTVKGMDLSRFFIDEKNLRLIVKSGLGQVLRGDPIVKLVIDDVSATIKDMQWSFKQDYFPYMTGQGIAHAQVKGVCIILGFQLVKRAKSKIHQIVETVTGEANEEPSSSASTSSASTPNGSSAKEVFVPQMVLGVSRVTIDSVKINLEGPAIYSMLTEVFANTIRTYASSLMQDMIVEKISTHLEKANEKFALHVWETLSSALEIDVDRLPSEETAAKRAEQLEGAVGGRKDVYSVTFTQDGPMGLALGKWNEFVVVKSFKKAKDGSTLPAELSGKIKVGDILVGFNGGEITSLPLDRVTTRISRSRRPLTLSFAPGDVHSMEATKKRNHLCKFRFDEDKLFLLIKGRPCEDRAAVVTGFRPTKLDGGGEGPAEKAGVPVGWVLAGINGASMLDKTFKDTMNAFASTTARPIELKFVRDPDYEVELHESPVDLKLASFEGGMVVVAGFAQLKSPAETLLGDGIQSGDFVSGIAGKDTMLMKFDDIISLMRSSPRPMEIRFGRYGVNGITSAASFGPGPLGMVFYRSGSDGRCCFKAFQGIEGPVERLKQVYPGSVIRTINGVAVTSEEQARDLLSKPQFPLKIGLRDMEAYEAGGWKGQS